jgi:hypothetical protein
MTTSGATSLTQRAHDQHVDLTRRLEELRRLLTGDFAWETVETLLAELQHLLQEHFDLKETGGYLEEVLNRNPNRAAEVRTLRDQHQQLSDELQRVRHLALDRSSADELRRDLGRWILMLLAHELHENLIVQNAFTRDDAAID